VSTPLLVSIRKEAERETHRALQELEQALLAVIPLASTISLDHCPNSFWLNDAGLRRRQPRWVPRR
jgi:hypothetical protein